MRIFGLAGWSGSGKTTLLTALIPELVARGVTVSTIKHAHHDFDIDQPGKDSWRHRQAGAARGDGRLGAALGADARAARRARAAARRPGRADEPGRSAAGRGLQAAPASEARSPPAVGRQAAARSRRSASSSRSPRTKPLPGLSLPAAACRSAAIADFILAHAGSGIMAQLSDDCFAFGGELLRRRGARADRRARLGRRRSRDRAAGGSGRAHPGPRSSSRRSTCRRTPTARSTAMRSPMPIFCPTARRCCRSADAPPPAIRSAARSGSGEAIRIFTGAPMPEGADTVMMQEDCIGRERPGQAPARHQARAPTAATPARTSRQGALALPAGRRLEPADLGLAAALGLDPLPVYQAAARRAAVDRRRGARARRRAAARRDLRRQPHHAGGAAARASAAPSAISASGPTAKRRSPTRWRRRRRARSDRHLGRRVDRRGGPCQGRDRAARAARFLAAGDQAGPAGGAGPGRRRAADRPAGQPGRGDRDLRRPRPAADPAPRRRDAAAAAAVPVAPASPTARSRGAANICAPASNATATGDRASNTPRTAPASCLRSCARRVSSSSTRRSAIWRPARWSISCPLPR